MSQRRLTLNLGKVEKVESIGFFFWSWFQRSKRSFVYIEESLHVEHHVTQAISTSALASQSSPEATAVLPTFALSSRRLVCIVGFGGSPTFTSSADWGLNKVCFALRLRESLPCQKVGGKVVLHAPSASLLSVFQICTPLFQSHSNHILSDAGTPNSSPCWLGPWHSLHHLRYPLPPKATLPPHSCQGPPRPTT